MTSKGYIHSFLSLSHLSVNFSQISIWTDRKFDRPAEERGIGEPSFKPHDLPHLWWKFR